MGLSETTDYDSVSDKMGQNFTGYNSIRGGRQKGGRGGRPGIGREKESLCLLARSGPVDRAQDRKQIRSRSVEIIVAQLHLYS